MADEGTELGEAVVEPQGPGKRRRPYRGIAVTAVTGLVVGALIGAGAVAWHTDTLPFGEDEGACWGAFSKKEQAALMPDLDGEPWSEQAPGEGEKEKLTADTPLGECHIGAGKRTSGSVTLQIEELGEIGGSGEDGPSWAEANLSSLMTSFASGHGEDAGLGMTSPNRAWREIPGSCLRDDAEGGRTPYVVTLTRANGTHLGQDDGPAQRDMARGVTRAANAVLRKFGCKAALTVPDKIAAPPKTTDTRDLCGVEGLGWPRGLSAPPFAELSSAGDSRGPARTCDLLDDASGIGIDEVHGATSFTTVTDPRLAQIYHRVVLYGGPKIRQVGSEKGYGALGTTLTAFRTQCQGRDVVFAAKPREDIRRKGEDGREAVRRMFPRYVAAEAEKAGCGDVELEMPAATG